MELSEAMNKRRSQRALEKAEITESLIRELAYAACLAPSCYNNQPWKYLFIKDEKKLNELFDAYSKGNEWCQKASLVIAVISKKDDDCVIGSRTYYYFDTGMSTAFLLLKATELGLIAHPIAGFDPEKIKKIINLPSQFELISLIICGKKSDDLSSLSKKWQIESENERPARKSFEQYCFIDNFTYKADKEFEDKN